MTVKARGPVAILIVAAFVLSLIPSSAGSLSFETVSFLGTVLSWNKYRTKKQASAIKASINKEKKFIRHGDRNIKIVFDPTAYKQGALGFNIKSMKADQKLSFWIFSPRCNITMQVRLFTSKDSFWESAVFKLDYKGWKKFLLSPGNTNYNGVKEKNRKWEKAGHVQLLLEGSGCVIYVDELKFLPPYKEPDFQPDLQLQPE